MTHFWYNLTIKNVWKQNKTKKQLNIIFLLLEAPSLNPLNWHIPKHDFTKGHSWKQCKTIYIYVETTIHIYGDKGAYESVWGGGGNKGGYFVILDTLGHLYLLLQFETRQACHIIWRFWAETNVLKLALMCCWLHLTLADSD